MPNDNLQIVITPGNRDGQKILSLKGSLNIQTIFGFQSAVRAESSPMVILDFIGVPFIDSAGLGALVGAYVAAQKKPQRMAVVGMNTQVKALVEMTKVSQLIKSFNTIGKGEKKL